MFVKEHSEKVVTLTRF